MTARLFEARYGGFCADCGSRFGVGDHVGYDIMNDLVCAGCLDAPVRDRSGRVCSRCFVEISPSGTCNCWGYV